MTRYSVGSIVGAIGGAVVQRAILLSLVAMVSSCSQETAQRCELTEDGVALYVSDESGLYSDITSQIRNGALEELINAAPNVGGAISSPERRPLVCVTERDIRRTIEITYPARAEDQVGAVLDIYLGENGQTNVIEFYVIPKAP